MKRLIVAASMMTLAATLPAQTTTHPMTFNDMASIRRIGSPQLSPDGQWLAYVGTTPDLAVNKNRSSLFLIPAAGGASRRLTDAGHLDQSPMWSPDGKFIAFVSDRDGDTTQIYLADVASGSLTKVSTLPGGASAIRWVPDGSALLATSDIYPDCGVDPQCAKSRMDLTDANPVKARVIDSLLYRHWKSWQGPTRSHILYVPLRGNPVDLTQGRFDAPFFSLGGGDEFDISPDGKEVVYTRNVEDHQELSTNSDLFLVPTAGGLSRRITTRKGGDTSPHYSPDGKWIAYISQARAGYESDLWELTLYNRSTGAITRTAKTLENGVSSITWAPDSMSIFITAEEKSKQPIFEVSLPGGALRRIYGEGSSDSVLVSPDGRTLFFACSSLTRPADLFSVARSGGSATQLTHDNDGVLSTIRMGETSDIWYKGAESANVQALMVKPPNFDAHTKYPGLVLIHGGPQGAWNDAWGYRWNPQMFAAAGYVVLMPNQRGSTGYGQKFVEEISGDWGGKAYTDIMNGVDKLAALPYVYPGRIGAAGASYGGYMIEWILGHTDRFKALVTHDGVYNLEAMYGATEELWFPEWEFHGNPWDNPELYQKWSPNRFVKNFKTPTLVVHGELDYRVPVSQGMELFTALQRRGVPSRFLYFPDEGHWVLKPQNSRLWYQTVTGWLDQFLKD
jgi:dipeptidyl aminopeptidase/acylaminoacyl peptidase